LEDFMKKRAGKIAMILVLVILAHSFTACELLFGVVELGAVVVQGVVEIGVAVGDAAASSAASSKAAKEMRLKLINDNEIENEMVLDNDIDTFSKLIKTLPDESVVAMLTRARQNEARYQY